MNNIFKRINGYVGTTVSIISLILTIVFYLNPITEENDDSLSIDINSRVPLIQNVSDKPIGSVNTRKNQPNNSLIIATKEGSHLKVDKLIKQGYDPNIRDDNGRTALMLAISSGNINSVESLVNAGADVNAKIKYDWNGVEYTPLLWAAYVEKPNLSIIDFLISNGADISLSNSYGTNALMFAAEKGHFEVVKSLIDKGVSVNAVTKNNATAIMYAAMSGKAKVAKLLLNNGADISLKVDWGADALLFAAREYEKSSGHLNVIELLLDNGANINSTDKSGNSALMELSWSGHTEAVKLLIDRGANVNLINNNNMAAIYSKYLSSSNEEIVDILREAGAYESYLSKFIDWLGEHPYLTSLMMFLLGAIFLYVTFVLFIRVTQKIVQAALPRLEQFVKWKL